VMIAEARGIASIPEELSSAEAAPLLCAGITTYNALRNAGLRGGDLVAVRASVASGILASSLRGTWDFIPSQSGVDARRKT
jgi:alcohol dehydrogenase, propanol-preferring